MSDIVVAEAKLRDAKRGAVYAFMSRTQNLQLERAKQTGRILALNQHTKELAEVQQNLQTLKQDCKYGNIDAYVTDSRVDDFLAHYMMEEKQRKLEERMERLDKCKQIAHDLWDQQVQYLEPNHPGSLAVLNYVSGNIGETFLIDPERCKCGRLFHFNATLSMNFCTVHKVYFPVLSADDKSNKKPKQNAANYTNNNGNNARQGIKTPRLVITSSNQICAANNVLYQQHLQPSQDRVNKSAAELRKRLVQREHQQQQQMSKPIATKPPKIPKAPKAVKPPKPPKIAHKQTRQQKQPKKPHIAVVKHTQKKVMSNAEHLQETTVSKQTRRKSKKDSCALQHPSSPVVVAASTDNGSAQPNNNSVQVLARYSTSEPVTKDTSLVALSVSGNKRKTENKTTEPLPPKKQQLAIGKQMAQYELYLMQFAPDAPEITSAMLQKIHTVISSVAVFGESRSHQEIAALVEKCDLFRDVRSHIDRILKLSLAYPVPVIDAELRRKLLSRFEEVQRVLLSWQHTNDSDSTAKNRRRFCPGQEALTHIFLLSENQWQLAVGFAAHPTLKVGLEQSLRFRELIRAVAQRSQFTWKCDFDLHVDTQNNRIV